MNMAEQDLLDNQTKEQWAEKIKWRPDEDYVFVSYSSADWQKVYPTILCLQDMGFNIYIDTEFTEEANTEWLDKMTKKMSNHYCKGIITFVSINSLRSYAVLIEQYFSYNNKVTKKFMKDMNHPLDAKIPNFYIGLYYNTPQKVFKEVQDLMDESSEMDDVSMLPKETDSLKEYREIYLAKKGKTDKEIEKELKNNQIENKYDITLLMCQLFMDNGFNLIEFGNTDDCSKLLARNFTGDKNNTIQFMPNSEFIKDKSEKDINLAETNEEIAKPAQTGRNDKSKEPMQPAAAQETEEVPEPKKSKAVTTTGDITYMLYGHSYKDNQSGLMLNVFEEVIKRHPKLIPTLQQTMHCVSSIDFSDPQNMADMPSYFRACRTFSVDGQQVCVGTSYSMKDKLNQIAHLFQICGENPDVLSMEGMELPQKTASLRSSAGSAGSTVNFTLFDVKHTSNQSVFMLTVFEEIMRRTPESAKWALNNLTCATPIDYSDEKNRTENMPSYFRACKTFLINDSQICIGTAYSLQDKLKMIARLLKNAGFANEVLSMEGYVLPNVK